MDDHSSGRKDMHHNIIILGAIHLVAKTHEPSTIKIYCAAKIMSRLIDCSISYCLVRACRLYMLLLTITS